jgi:hypothetical protein
MIVNMWVIVSDAAQAEIRDGLTNPDYNGVLSLPERILFSYCQDNGVRVAQYERPNLSGTDYNLWSIDFDTDNIPVAQAKAVLDGLLDRFPNQIEVGGAWKWDGAMVGCELVLTDIPNPGYVGEPYEIPNPAYQPDPEQPDYDPSENIRNPAWVPETIVERSQTGTPTYPIPSYLWRFIPGAASNDDLADVNRVMGQAPRVFT